MSVSPLVTIAGDGTFRPVTDPASRGPAMAGSRLEALGTLRSLLGEDLEEQIATELHLPAALGLESADQLLPASLALLAETSGDLASYGWRLGPGAGLAWLRAQELRGRTVEDARYALLGHEGPLRVATLGPATLAAGTYLASGERTLGDRGAVRDLPGLLAEGIAQHLDAVREAVPGSMPRLLVREDAVRAVHAGTLSSPSGYRRYPALPAAEIGDLWRALLETLGSADLAAEHVRLQVPAVLDLLRAALQAGARSIALAVTQIGPLSDPAARLLWESLAEARESGIDLAVIADPAQVGQTLEVLSATWRQLGYGDHDLAGLTVLAHRRPGRAAEADDPSDEPGASSLLHERDLVRVLRAAPSWAERVQR